MDHKKLSLHEKLDKIQKECPLALHTGAGRLYTMVRRMRIEEELDIPIHLRTGAVVSSETGKEANVRNESEWIKFYGDLCEELNRYYPNLYNRLFWPFSGKPPEVTEENRKEDPETTKAILERAETVEKLLTELEEGDDAKGNVPEAVCENPHAHQSGDKTTNKDMAIPKWDFDNIARVLNFALHNAKTDREAGKIVRAANTIIELAKLYEPDFFDERKFRALIHERGRFRR